MKVSTETVLTYYIVYILYYLLQYEKRLQVQSLLVRPTGIEPTHPAPEAGALSTELRAQIPIEIVYQKNLQIQVKKIKKTLKKVLTSRK